MDRLPTALRALMKRRGISEAIELAGISGVATSTVSLYLSGKRGLVMNSQARSTVEKYAAALGVQPIYFIEYRRWFLHQELDRWIDEDAAAVDLLLQHVQVTRPGLPE